VRVKKSLLALALCAVFVVGALQSAQAAGRDPNPLRQKEADCGLPSKYPLWIDFGDGSVPFWDMFAQPGLVSAAANFIYPPRIRALGGHTVYFDLNFHKRLGSPAKPVDEASVVQSANKLFYYAAASSGCTHPWIALNELFGAGLPTPWSPSNTLYRANVLEFIKILSDRGGHPFLLVNSQPYTADEAGDWWRQVAQYADIVREIYFPAPAIYSQGAVLGSRTLRQDFRQGILDFTSIGIPVAKLGIFLGFQTERGEGGREGLTPAVKWYETIKWQVLAAGEVARELKFATIWSWGWGEWGGQSVDPDKPNAACVYLWARSSHYCNGPAVAGPSFDRSKTEGQINFSKGTQCLVGGRRLATDQIVHLRALTRDPQAAFSAAFARIVESRYAQAAGSDVTALERAVVATRFGGSYSAYVAALKKAGASVGVARGVIADELRQGTIESRFRVGAPSSAQIAAYYQSYGNLPAREVGAVTPPWWLGGLKDGLAISSIAPDQVFRAPAGRWTTVVTALGQWRIRPLGATEPLAAAPLSQATPSIRAAIMQTAQANAYQSWSAARQRVALKTTVCRGDALPQVGGVDLVDFLPFLAL
jgi:hypothetical protein